MHDRAPSASARAMYEVAVALADHLQVDGEHQCAAFGGCGALD